MNPQKELLWSLWVCTETPDGVRVLENLAGHCKDLESRCSVRVLSGRGFSPKP